MELVQSYVNKIGYKKTAHEYLIENKGFVKEKDGRVQVSVAAILLFGREPQRFFPRARVRFIKYEGTEEKFGTEMNVIKDVIFEGTVLKMIKDSIAYLDTQIKEKTYLGQDGLFVTEEEYPKFVRQEIVVNAVTHRSYSISGTEIQIKMFDDRIVVESPGKFPGLVRANNIRHTHFSRNPKIAEYLKAYEYVKEYGEGVDRMCRELEEVGLKVPQYHCNSFILKTTVFNATAKEKLAIGEEKLAIGEEKLAIGEEKLAIGEEKLAIGEEKLAIGEEKLAIEYLKLAIAEQKFREQTKYNIIRVYEEIDTNQIFGSSEIAKILDCSPANARIILAKIRSINVLVEVVGKGKGKYRFKNVDEV